MAFLGETLHGSLDWCMRLLDLQGFGALASLGSVKLYAASLARDNNKKPKSQVINNLRLIFPLLINILFIHDFPSFGKK